MAKKEKNKIKLPINYDFESKNQKYDFTKICRDMQKADGWKDLSLRQQGLYLYLKSKFTVNLKTMETNKDNISIPTSEANKIYGDLRTFRKDIDELIEHGFIRQIVSGVPTMSANIYGFSDEWKRYGTEYFRIEDSDRRYKRKPKKA